MKIVEFYPEKQGRPYSPGFVIASHSVRGVHLAGEFSRTTKTDDYTAGDEMVILVDASGGNVIITLPPAATSSSKVYWIKNVGETGTVTIKGDESEETIDGEVSIDLTLQYQYVMIICDALDWYILGGEYVKMEDILKVQETLLEKLTKQLRAILTVVASGQDLSNKEEDYN